VKFKGK